MTGVIFIAEVSSNHAQNLDRCFSFIEKAAECGCDAIKFQLFRVDQLFSAAVLAASVEHQNRVQWELPLAFLPKIARKCHAEGLQFGCTPFYLKAVEELAPYVDFYKIASYELLWDTLLECCAATGKPVILSTGMADREEIDHALQVLGANGCNDLTLLHCVSGYPTPVGECNLGAIKALRQTYDCVVGWSDHSRSPAVLHRAVHCWKAALIEFHLDLDGLGAEYRHGHCWLPDEIAQVISSIKEGFTADGDGAFAIQKCEAADRDWRADPSDGLRPLCKVRNQPSLTNEGNG